MSGGLVAVAGALVLVPGGPRRHAVAGGAAYPAVLEAVVVPARFGAPDLALAVAERCPGLTQQKSKEQAQGVSE
jgi:hypothetical protein